MSQQTKTKAYALKVPKKQGEKSIHLINSLGLLNKNLKIVPEKDSLLIPMVKKPDSRNVEKIRKDSISFEIVIYEFIIQAKRPKSTLNVATEQLPPNLRASLPHAIDFIGKIAVIEIPAELADYKAVVGEAILEAHKNVRTVLAKSSAVEGTYRLREFEVIAGLHNTETIHREHGCMYYVDLSKVYFSPRLSSEHQRVALQVTENEIVIDMFAGVGPFSILIAKLCNDVKVYAVDVNSDAVQFLEKNVNANNVLGKVVPILGDARKVVKGKLLGTADRVIMNLPEKAEEYVDVACEAIKPEGGIIHYYEFSKGANATEIAEKHLTEAVSKTGRNISEFLSARIVREVAPFKWQVAVDAIIC